jgi:hypothetical protein
MKTILFFALFGLVIQVDLSAQQYPYGPDPGLHPQFQRHAKFIQTEGNLKPVYFSYTRRQLYYDNNIRVNGNDFLNMCRGIHDVQIKRQIARYDQLTKKKKILVAASIVCGVSGYLCTVVGASMSSYNSGQAGFLVTGLTCLIATPILAISTSIPHQKRKEVVFRDLPNAYNIYVFNQK